MSTVVAVAGGTGGLGHAIIDALRSDGRYEVLVLSRKVCLFPLPSNLQPHSILT